MSNYAFTRSEIIISPRVIIPQSVIDQIKTDYGYFHKASEYGNEFFNDELPFINDYDKIETERIRINAILSLIGDGELDERLYQFIIQNYYTDERCYSDGDLNGEFSDSQDGLIRLTVSSDMKLTEEFKEKITEYGGVYCPKDALTHSWTFVNNTFYNQHRDDLLNSLDIKSHRDYTWENEDE